MMYNASTGVWDVVQYCYNVMQRRWFYVCLRWIYKYIYKYINIRLHWWHIYATGTSRKKMAGKNRGTPWFFEHVFVFNLFWFVRVKLELLMEVTIHIYCSFILAHWLLLSLWRKSRELLSDQVLFLLFRTVTGSILSLYIFVCILFYLFISPHTHTERAFWVWGHKCCKYNWDVDVLRGFIFSRTLCRNDAVQSSSGQPNTQAIPTHTQSTHTRTQRYQHIKHIHLNLHMEGFIKATCDLWMGCFLFISLEGWCVSQYLSQPFIS